MSARTTTSKHPVRILPMALCLLSCLTVRASEPFETTNLPPDESFPEELRDQAFERFADIAALATAIRNGDASALVDGALQLAEGERILVRSHRAIKADTVFALAVRVAIDKGDQSSLTRLEKASRTDQKTLLESARKLAAVPRALKSPKVSLTDLNPRALRAINDFVETIQVAGRTGDSETLRQIVAGMKADDVGFTPDIKKYLTDLAENAIQRLAQTDEAERETILRLTSPSRGIGNKVSLKIKNSTNRVVTFYFSGLPLLPFPQTIPADSTKTFTVTALGEVYLEYEVQPGSGLRLQKVLVVNGQEWVFVRYRSFFQPYEAWPANRYSGELISIHHTAGPRADGMLDLLDNSDRNQSLVGRFNTISSTDLDFTKGNSIRNDAVHKLNMYAVLPGTKIILFDNSKGFGGGFDDRLEIYVKQFHAGPYRILNLEKSFEDYYVKVDYFRKNGLNGKVSRLEIRPPAR